MIRICFRYFIFLVNKSGHRWRFFFKKIGPKQEQQHFNYRNDLLVDTSVCHLRELNRPGAKRDDCVSKKLVHFQTSKHENKKRYRYRWVLLKGRKIIIASSKLEKSCIISPGLLSVMRKTQWNCLCWFSLFHISSVSEDWRDYSGYTSDETLIIFYVMIGYLWSHDLDFTLFGIQLSALAFFPPTAWYVWQQQTSDSWMEFMCYCAEIVVKCG